MRGASEVGTALWPIQHYPSKRGLNLEQWSGLFDQHIESVAQKLSHELSNHICD